MPTAFFDNFRNAEKIIQGYSPYGEANLPSPNPGENSGAWEGREAIPFSFQKSDDGQRQFGIVYIPAYETKKFKESGKISGGDVQIYGAELADGTGLTADGFNKLYNENKDSDFKWNDYAGQYIYQGDDGKIRGAKTAVEDTKNFNILRNVVRTAQRNDRENFLRNKQSEFYNKYRDIINRG